MCPSMPKPELGKSDPDYQVPHEYLASDVSHCIRPSKSEHKTTPQGQGTEHRVGSQHPYLKHRHKNQQHLRNMLQGPDINKRKQAKVDSKASQLTHISPSSKTTLPSREEEKNICQNKNTQGKNRGLGNPRA